MNEGADAPQRSLFNVPIDPEFKKIAEELEERNSSADIDKIARECMLWADSAFPDRTNSSMFLKMYGELAELIDAGEACDDEVADILILVLDYAARKQVQIAKAVQRKLAINQGRTWVITAIGTMQHVENT